MGLKPGYGPVARSSHLPCAREAVVSRPATSSERWDSFLEVLAEGATLSAARSRPHG
jgi:hypothetical protein